MISHGIPRHHGTIGHDGQEGLSIFQTWDWWDVPWDPKAHATMGRPRTSYGKVGQPSPLCETLECKMLL